MIFCGIDPDLHSTALALADEQRVYAVKVVRVDKKLKDRQAVVAMCRELSEHVYPWLDEIGTYLAPLHIGGVCAEGQQRYVGKGGTPDVLINLSAISGAALALTFNTFRDITGFLQLPREWKGDVPKAIHQARLCSRYGWRYERKSDYCVPQTGLDEIHGVSSLKPADWKHVLDAVGLARWGACKAAGVAW